MGGAEYGGHFDICCSDFFYGIFELNVFNCVAPRLINNK